MVGGDICLLMGWQCLNWLRRGEDGDVADIVPCGRCDLKVLLNFCLFCNLVNIFFWSRAFISKIFSEICLHFWVGAVHSFINRRFNISSNIS